MNVRQVIPNIDLVSSMWHGSNAEGSLLTTRSGVVVARYFFHLCDGVDTLMDPEGREVTDASLLQ